MELVTYVQVCFRFYETRSCANAGLLSCSVETVRSSVWMDYV